jgi:hypothetical protein
MESRKKAQNPVSMRGIRRALPSAAHELILIKGIENWP